MAQKMTGALVFDERTDRYDIRFDLNSYYGGLHCGECFDIFVRGKWKPTRIEYGDNWYLVGIRAEDWLNIADTYCGTGNKGYHADPKNPKGRNGQQIAKNNRVSGCKQKDLIGIPWLLAFALRADGWYLRSDIIWQKENPMPESVKDRPTRCYEHIFLLTKSKKYFYDAAAIAEPLAPTTAARYRTGRSAGQKYADEVPGQGKVQGLNRARSGSYYDEALMPTMRNRRDVWLINTVPYKGGHFAAFPPKLAETCIKAGCPKGGVVLDPFFGSGTTGAAARQLDRHYIRPASTFLEISRLYISFRIFLNGVMSIS